MAKRKSVKSLTFCDKLPDQFHLGVDRVLSANALRTMLRQTIQFLTDEHGDVLKEIDEQLHRLKNAHNIEPNNFVDFAIIRNKLSDYQNLKEFVYDIRLVSLTLFWFTFSPLVPN